MRLTHRCSASSRPLVVLLAMCLVLLGTGPAGAQPTNDDFADAITIDLAAPGPVTASNTGASAEVGEPDHAGSWGDASVWWRFTPQISQQVLLLAQVTFDSVIAVYTGAAVDDLTLVAENDDYEGDRFASGVDVAVSAGTTYHVAVDSYVGETGSISLSWEIGQAFGALAVESPAGAPLTELDLGAQPVGGEAQRTFVLRNVGGGALTISDISIDARSFAEGEYRVLSGPDAGTVIPAGAQQEVVVAFTPLSAPAGAPAAVAHFELPADSAAPDYKFKYDDEGVIRAWGVYTYFRNAGGTGTTTYTATSLSDGLVTGQTEGSADLLGGDAYAMETVVTLGDSADQSQVRVTLPPDFRRTETFEPFFATETVPSFEGVEDVSFHRLADAILVIHSDDPAAQGDPDFFEPAGTFVALFGQGVGTAPPPPPSSDDVVRWAGPDRYATAAAISAAAFTAADTVYVATGANYPDALAGGPAAIRANAPILLTARDTLPQPTIAELQRLAPDRIIVLGGSAAVSTAVQAQLATLAPGGATRWAGPDRFATAAAVSAKAFPDGSINAFVATGANFPDALAGGPPAGLLDSPILLTRADGLPQATIDELTRLAPQDIIILGGSRVVSDAVAEQLAAYAAGDVLRWAGTDRFATAAAVSAAGFPGGTDIAFIATGANFPDALAGGPVGGQRIGPILLTNHDSLPAATAAELRRLTPDLIVVLGGTGAVSDTVARQLGTYIP